MTPKERVETAIKFKEPDRVPIDLWGSGCRITNVLYFRIAQHLGIDSYPEKVRPGKTAEYVDYRISDFIGSDFRHAQIRPFKESKSYINKDGLIIDEWGIGYKKVGEYPTVVYYPLANATISDIDNYKWPDLTGPDRLQGVVDEVKNWYENTDYYITAAGPISGLALDWCFYLRGMEQFFIDLYTDTKFAAKLLDKVSDILAELYVFFIEPIGKYIEWVEYLNDYGSQQKAFFPREKYRQLIKEPNEKVFNAVKKVAPNTKIFLHSCGAIRELIPEFIDSGVNILHSLQPKAKGMDSFELKKEFGKDIVFHGGVDLQGGIQGTKEDAIAEAKKRIEAFAPGGGYIFGPTNQYQSDLPLDNFFALYDTAREYGKYPIKIG